MRSVETQILLQRVAQVAASVVCPRCMAVRDKPCFSVFPDRAFLELDEIHIERKDRVKELFDQIRSV